MSVSGDRRDALIVLNAVYFRDAWIFPFGASAPPVRHMQQGLEAAIDRRLESEFAAAAPEMPEAGLYDRLLAEVERPLIVQALKATRGNQIRAAAVLGINRNTLRKKIQTLGIHTGRGD